MGISIRPEDVQDLAGLLNDVRAARKAYPQDIARIDAQLAEHTGGRIPTFQALTQAVRGLNTASYAAQTNARPGQVVADAVQQIGQTNRGKASPAMAAAMQAEQSQENARTGQAIGRSALRGATFNFDDNIARLIGAGQGQGGMYSPEGQANFEEFSQNNPLASGAANMIGSLPTGGLLGSLAKRGIAKVAASQAARLVPGAAEAAPTVAQVLNAQGAVPNAIRGAGIGGFYGGANALGDDRSAAEVVGATGLGVGAGAAFTGAIPLLRQAKKMVTDGAERVIANRAGQLGNDIAQGGGTLLQSAEPLTRRQKVYDMLVPQRAVDRVERGIQRLDQGQRELVGTGSSLDATVVDQDPTQTKLLGTELVNNIRGNPDAAAMSGVQALAARSANTGERMAAGIDASRASGGMRPLPQRNIPDAQLGRPAQLANTLETRLGAAPAVPSAVNRIGVQPSRAGYNADARVQELENTTRSWANSPQGYGGFSRTVDNSPEVLDQARLSLARAATDNADDATRGAFTTIQRNLQAIQGGVTESTPVHLERVQNALKEIQETIQAARLPRGAPGRLSINSDELAQLEFARGSLMQYADQGFTHRAGETFSTVTNQYARRKAQEDAVRTGINLYRGAGLEDGARAANAIQELNALPPSERTNANVGIISGYLDELRGGDVNNVTGVVRKLLTNRGGADRRNELLRAAFPSQREFNQFAMRQALNDAMDQGYAAFNGLSSAQLRSAVRQLGSPDARREFQSAMTQRFRDELENPENAQTLVKKMGRDLMPNDRGVTPAGSEYMQKFREMFGQNGAEEMRRRVLQQARKNEISSAVKDAATNTSSGQDNPAAMAIGRSGNARSPWTRLLGSVQKLVGAELTDAQKTDIVRILSEQGGQRFRDVAREYVRPGAGGGRAGLLGSALTGKGISSLLTLNNQQ